MIYNGYGLVVRQCSPPLYSSIRRHFSAVPRFDSYAELGVHRHSSDKEVREAYLKAVKQHHPDAGGNHEKFVRVRIPALGGCAVKLIMVK